MGSFAFSAERAIGTTCLAPGDWPNGWAWHGPPFPPGIDEDTYLDSWNAAIDSINDRDDETAGSGHLSHVTTEAYIDVVHAMQAKIETLIPYFYQVEEGTQDGAAHTKSTALTAAISKADWATDDICTDHLSEMQAVLNLLKWIDGPNWDATPSIESRVGLGYYHGAMPVCDSWDARWLTAKTAYDAASFTGTADVVGIVGFLVETSCAPFARQHTISNVRMTDVQFTLSGYGQDVIGTAVRAQLSTITDFKAVTIRAYGAANFAGDHVETILANASYQAILFGPVATSGEIHLSWSLAAEPNVEGFRPPDAGAKSKGAKINFSVQKLRIKLDFADL